MHTVFSEHEVVLLYRLFLKGIVTGLALSIPFGPVGIFCMEKTLSEGRMKGLVSAFGMITTDLFYTSLVLFFMDQVNAWIIRYELYFKILIGFLLVWISLDKLIRKKELKHLKYVPGSYLKNYTTTFVLGMGNLSSFFTVWLIFSALRVYVDIELQYSFLLIMGVPVGGVAEWLLVTFFLTHFKKTINDAVLLKITKCMNAVIFVFGLFILGMAAKQFVCLRFLAKHPRVAVLFAPRRM